MKYELVKTDSVQVGPKTLCRIKALKNFGNVKTGQSGGYIESESNLSQDGLCWVSENAYVYENARVSENAWVYGDARVYGNAEVSGNAWVYGNARVYENARVYGNAWVYVNAWVYGNAQVSGDAQVFGNAYVSGEYEKTKPKSTTTNRVKTLCEKVNEGFEALSELIRKHPSDFFKPVEKKFKSFKTNQGYEVDFKDDVLIVGCVNIPIDKNALLKQLNNLYNGDEDELAWGSKNRIIRLSVKRLGISVSRQDATDEIIIWEDVKKLIDELGELQ